MTWLLTMLWACAPADPPADGAPPDAVDHLIRASVAVRGLRPDEAEVAAVRADPGALEGLVDAWLDSDAFGAAVRDQHAEMLHLRGHVTGKLPAIGPLDGVPTKDLDHALDEAPLMLVEDIVRSGRPYTEVLTTDRTFTNALTAVVHGLPYDPDGPEWQAATWSDGRPAAGLLADTAVLQRYQSSLSNHHRGRGALVLSAFLCDGVLEASVDAGVPPEIDDPAEDRTLTDPQCARCHASLDPIASAFFGFDRYILAKDVTAAYAAGCPDGAPCFPLPMWRPDDEGAWADVGMPAPAFRGRAAADLEGLAATLAATDDFATCAARRFHGWHTGRAYRDVPDDVAAELASVFVASGHDARALVKASVLSEAFAEAPARSVRPEEIARTVEALTGYAWQADLGPRLGTIGLATDAEHGLRGLLGGTDGWDLLDPTRTSTASQALALDWLAREAAHHVVATEAAQPRVARRLFTVVDPGPAAEADTRAQLVRLHDVILQWRPADDDPAIDDALALFEAVTDASDAATAWEAVVAALLQHDRMVVL